MGSTKIEAPEPRDLAQEGRDTLATQIELAPQVFASEQEFRPQFAQLDLDILRDILPGVLDLERQATTSSRAGDVADVEALGGRATEAFRSANPQLSQIQDALTARALQGGGSAINDELQRQALEELRLGGSLSPGEQRDVQQATRSAFNSRGLARSDAGLFAEALNRQRFSDQREAQRRGFAQSVDQQGLQRDQFGANLLGTTGQFLSATSSDPFQAILGRSAAPQGVGGAGFSLASQPTIFNPFDPAAQSVFAGNQQQILDTRAANASNSSSLLGAGIGALGSIGSAFAFCWVARAAYGPENPGWRVWRAWMMGSAPAWFVRWYWRNGQGVAAWMERHPWSKRWVRWAMDGVLAVVGWTENGRSFNHR